MVPITRETMERADNARLFYIEIPANYSRCPQGRRAGFPRTFCSIARRFFSDPRRS